MHKGDFTFTEVKPGSMLSLIGAQVVATDPEIAPDMFKSHAFFTCQRYACVKLVDGSSHWVVSMDTSAESGFVAILAIDIETGLLYSIATHSDKILSLITLPEGMVERMPEMQQPFGFNKQ